MKSDDWDKISNLKDRHCILHYINANDFGDYYEWLYTNKTDSLRTCQTPSHMHITNIESKSWKR